MTWTLEVASNAAASSWTDVTALVDRKTWRIGGECPGGGQAGTGFGFDFADDAAAYEFPARRVVRFTIGSTVCGRGRVAVKDLGRGTAFVGDTRQYAVNFTDGNAHLQGIPVHGWDRPAETDVARITALCADFLAGSPRASTDLATTYLSSDGPVDLEAKVYDSTNPAGVVAEIERIAGKLFFVTVDDEVFYDRVDSANYNASLSVTDSSPNLTSSFPPIADGPVGTQDGSELYSGLGLTYGNPSTTIYGGDSTAESDHDYWQEIVNSDATTSEQAAAELASLLEFRKVEEDRFRFAIRLTEAQVDLVKYGQNISFRSAAAGILSPITIRIARLVWEEFAPGIYLAHIENAKLAPRLGRGQRLGIDGVRLPPAYLCDPGRGDALSFTWIAPVDATTFDGSAYGDASAYGGTNGSDNLMIVLAYANPPPGQVLVLSDEVESWQIEGNLTFSGAGFTNTLGIPVHFHDFFVIGGLGTLGDTGHFGLDLLASGYASGPRREEIHWNNEFGDAQPLHFKIRRIETSVGVFRSEISYGLLSTLIDNPWTVLPGSPDFGPLLEIMFSYEKAGGGFPADPGVIVQVTDLVVRSCAGADPLTGQQVYLEAAGTSDGSTSGYVSTFPYAPGTLEVVVDGLPWTDGGYVETDPTTGDWEFTQVPETGDTIQVTYRAA